MTETAQQTKKRGLGPIKFDYVGRDGTTSPRPTDTKDVVIKATGNSEEILRFDVTQLDQATLYSLAAQAYTRFIETYARNHLNADGSNLAEIVQARSDEIKEGKLHMRIGGAAPARTIDVSPWVDSMRRAYELRKVHISDEQLAAFQAKLENMSGKDRQLAIAKLRKDPIYNAALMEVTAKLAKERMKQQPKQAEFDLLSQV
jgi:hypothetical protein